MRRLRRNGAMIRGFTPDLPGDLPPVRRGECGFVTIFALGLAACLSIILGLAMQANTSLHDLNRHQAERLQTRAATLTLR